MKNFISINLEREEWSIKSQLCVVSTKITWKEVELSYMCIFCLLLLHFCKPYPIFVVTICNLILNHREFKEGCSSKIIFWTLIRQVTCLIFVYNMYFAHCLIRLSIVTQKRAIKQLGYLVWQWLWFGAMVLLCKSWIAQTHLEKYKMGLILSLVWN